MITNSKLKKLMQLMQEHQITELTCREDGSFTIKHDTIAKLTTKHGDIEHEDDEKSALSPYSIEEAHLALSQLGKDIHE